MFPLHVLLEGLSRALAIERVHLRLRRRQRPRLPLLIVRLLKNILFFLFLLTLVPSPLLGRVNRI